MIDTIGGSNQCIICTEDYSKDHKHCATELECGNVFGRSCIVKWDDAHSSCPMCRQPFIVPENPSAGRLTTAMKGVFTRERGFYAIAAVATLLYQPSPAQVALFNAKVILSGLGLWATAQISKKTHDAITDYLGSPSDLGRGIVASCAFVCSTVTAGAILSNLTIKPLLGV